MIWFANRESTAHRTLYTKYRDAQSLLGAGDEERIF